MFSIMKASKRAIFLALILFYATLPHALTDTDRLSKLNAVKKASPSSFIKFDIDTFSTFIESAPRSYAVIVMFSADASLCQPCGALRRQFVAIAKEYEALSAKRKSPRPLFFAEIEVSPSDQQFLAKYGLQHVPVLYHFKSGASRTYPTLLSEESADYYPLQQLGISPNQLKAFVNSRSRSQFTIVRGGYQIPFVQTVRAFMPLILIVVSISVLIAIMTGAYKSPMLWFAVVVLVYIFSVGGGHYSWIHNTPLVTVNKDGVWEYIAGGSRSQYVAEGFFVSVTCVAISVLVILIQELPTVLPSKSGQTVVGSAMVFLTLCAICALLVMYQIKMPSYLRYQEM